MLLYEHTQITFITANRNKIQVAKDVLADFDIKVHPLTLDITEIQNYDPLEIAIQKAESAYKITKQPIVVHDSYWEIPALNGFPGGYMKDVTTWLTAENFIDLMQNQTDRRICRYDTVIYKDQNQQKGLPT